MPTNLATSYVSRALEVPPHVARAAFDAKLAGTRPRNGVIVMPGGRLVARGPIRVAPGVPYSPYRSQRVSIVTGLRSWPGELELWPWSDERTELGFAPANAAFRRLPGESVVSTAHDLLEKLADALEAWSDQPLRSLV